MLVVGDRLQAYLPVGGAMIASAGRSLELPPPKKLLKKYLTDQSTSAILRYAPSKRHEEAADRRGVGFDVGKQLRHDFSRRDLRAGRGQKGKLLLFLQVEVRTDRRCIGGRMEQKQGEHGRSFFSNSSASRAVRSLFRSCARPSGPASRSVRFNPRMPYVKHRERGEHTRPRGARHRGAHLGSEDKVFRVRDSRRACAGIN